MSLDLAAPAISNGSKLSDELFSSLDGYFEPVPLSPWYRLGVLLVAVAMLLLPISYLCLIAVLGYGIYYHAVHHLALIDVFLILYILPLWVGPIVLFFLIKPLFMADGETKPPHTLKREDEPWVFLLVEKICARVGAPVPKRIDVDCSVNASVTLQLSWSPLHARQDLVLTLGLPLIAGLSLQQLVGLLAHELGHFTQRAGLRLSLVISSVNRWFQRIVDEQDVVYRQLKQAGREADTLNFINPATRILVRLTRGILSGLKWVGQFISSFLLRQMEFDADRYFVRLVGADVFESFFRETAHLEACNEVSFEDVGHVWGEGYLPTSLPGLIHARRQRLDAELCQVVLQELDNQETGWLDTHPAFRDRIANAQREGERPIFSSKIDAPLLFCDFDGLSRTVSLDIYRSAFGQTVRFAQLMPAEQVLARQETIKVEKMALDRFFQGTAEGARFLCPWVPREPSEASDVDEIRRIMSQTRERLVAGRSRYLESLAQFQEADADLQKAAIGRALLAVLEDFDAEGLGLPSTDLSDIETFEASARDRENHLGEAMAEMERTAWERLEAAACICQFPHLMDRRIDSTVSHQELSALFAVARGLHSVSHLATELSLESTAWEVLVKSIAEEAKYLQRMKPIADQVIERLRQISQEDALTGLSYPFDDVETTGIDLGTWLVPELPCADDFQEVSQACKWTLSRTKGLYSRVMGRLAVVGEELEAAVGLAVLE